MTYSTYERIGMGPEITKASVPVGIISTQSVWINWSIGDIVAVATLLYILLQIVVLVWRWKREMREDALRNEKLNKPKSDTTDKDLK